MSRPDRLPPQRREGESDHDLIRRRQKGRATVMAVLLGALVVLIFAITLAKIRMGMM